MNLTKTLNLLYLVIAVIAIAVLFSICVDINQLLTSSNGIETLQKQYADLQKNAATYSIIAFMVLLSISLVIYYFTNKSTFIILSNIIYITVILYVFLTKNQTYFNMQNLEHAKQNEYWLILYIGIFYIIGAVLVSAIGFITVRNSIKRLK